MHDSNTSHVTINPVSVPLTSQCTRIQIHLMLLLIFGADRGKSYHTIIQIHLMLLLIDEQREHYCDVK